MRIDRVIVAGLVAGLVAAFAAVAGTHAQKIIRAGAYLVQVDAYPVRDGRPITGLSAKDFEILEDGTPQTIDSVRFLEFPIWSPDRVRRDPTSQRESFELAGDPSNRVFVVYLNRIDWINGNYVEPALMAFLDRTLGPRDYVAIMSALQSPGDVVFSQLISTFKTESERFLDIVDWTDPRFMTTPEAELLSCFPGDEGLGLVARWRADDVYRDLEGLVSLLGSLRDTRSTLIFVSQGLFDPSTSGAIAEVSRTAPRIVPPAGRMPLPGGRGSFQPEYDPRMVGGRCEDLRQAALEPWSPSRFRDLLARARTANVAISPVNPRGLVADPDYRVMRAAEGVNDLMRSMASETGGVAIVNTNDLRAGFRKVADSLTAHYVLAYYSTNQAKDGRVRRITVKLRSSGETIRARREYRAAEDTPVLRPASTPAPDATGGPTEPPEDPISIDGAPAEGSSSAPTVMVAFSDFQCPYCAKFATEVLPQLRTEFTAPGAVQMVFRNLPLPIHPQARAAAVAAICAGQQGQFWPMHDRLFANQSKLSVEDLESSARVLALDLPRWADCARVGGPDVIADDLETARSLGIRATPFFLVGRREVDGRVRVTTVVAGAKPLSEFRRALRP